MNKGSIMVKHDYLISGMTCNGCVATVKKILVTLPGITSAEVTLNPPAATLMVDRHIETEELKKAFKDHPKYQIEDAPIQVKQVAVITETEDVRSFWERYKPIFLIFGYILGATLLVEISGGTFEPMRWMRHFMAGFFLVFSFFKLLDVSSFAASYRSYDIIAKRWPGWGYIYPFIELTFAILFLTNIQMIYTNAATFLIMGISSIGVIQTLLAKRKIQCACLGAVFNLPMSTITLIEDLLMVAMSGIMIFYHL
ncbi:MAG: MauE/DoxX family redox-associated membrane protein [Saprospiraceae bacterium]